MRIFIATIAIVLLSHSLTVCQDSLIVSRALLEKVAKQLDSFDVFKLKEVEWLEYERQCEKTVEDAFNTIDMQDSLSFVDAQRIQRLESLEQQRQIRERDKDNYIANLEKQGRGARTRSKIYLIGGIVLSVGLTTGLLIVLLK